ncbi:hypothetical protein HMPREF0373_00758 [Eubacterium ramulus ATCC 29099]|uniref:Uncharacterized protein n=1 Tax=Eubacterium ramulus ATCC 29099 TaxID=1256908 RepID=U2Q2E3_EUBRA|nr:hypothetical protein HMPREF0373_00758 [Eubacterium ramulus ATCC 29099]
MEHSDSLNKCNSACRQGKSGAKSKTGRLKIIRVCLDFCSGFFFTQINEKLQFFR